MVRKLLAALIALTVPATAVADEPLFEARFLDGSVVMVSVAEASVAIQTKYGRLTVPLAEVKKIDLGFHYPDGVEAKVRAAVEDLGATDYQTREEAQKALIAAGEYAVPAVRTGLKSSSPEAAERCGQILKKIADKVPAEKMEPREADVIVTEELTIRGKIETAGFKAKSRYFGEATVKLADLREFRPVGSKADGRFALDAAKYAKQGWATWYDTGMEVAKDQAIEITCTGKIDQWPQEPGRYVAGPGGTQAPVAGPGVGGAIGGAAVGGKGMPAAGPGGGFPGGAAYLSGAVYGKIGPNGAIFKVGDSYKQGDAPATGKLFLIVAPSNWGNECTGEYQVKVKVGG